MKHQGKFTQAKHVLKQYFNYELILKVRFFTFIFLPKNERNNSSLLVVDLFSFVFWEKVKAPKNPSEIN